MDQASNDNKGTKDVKPASTKNADTKPEGSSDGAKSKNDKKPGSQKSNPSSNLAAKSKIPERKTKPPTTTTTKTKTDSPMSTSMTGAAQKTVSRMSLAKNTNIRPNKSEASFSRTSLASKALSPSSAKTAPSPPVTGQTRPIQKRADSNASRKSASSSAVAPKPDTESGKLRKITSTAGDQNKLDTWEKKVTDVQTEFLKVLDTIKAEKNSDEKMEKEYKLISFVKNDTCKIMIKEDQLKKIPQKLPADSIGDLKEKIKKNLTQHFEKLNALTDNPDERVVALEAIKTESTKDICELMDNLCSSTKDDTSGDTQQLQKLQKELKETKEALKSSEAKLAEASKEHGEEIAKLENNAKGKTSDELTKKEGQIKDLHKKLKSLEKQHEETKKDLVEKATSLEEELKASKDSVTAIQKKLNNTEQLLSNERKEVKSKNEMIKKLEGEVANLNKTVEEMKNKSKTDNKAPEYLRQISELRNNVNSLETEKHNLEIKIEEMNSASTTGNNELRSKLIDSEKQMQILKKKISEYESHSKAKLECSKDVQMELAKLRQSESEKRREIDKLKVELSKSLFNIEQLKGQIQRDQQLLEVRSELINSLQTNEKNQRIQMEELFAQVGEKNTAVNELNNELRTKSDGYRELCSAINAKQLELSNQAHMIKLLEESNQRSQMLRVKQEEKISRMEEDIAHLKQTIALYQNNILSNSPKLAYPPLMARPQDDYNENLYYYTSERKRKRQVDINVRKYEA